MGPTGFHWLLLGSNRFYLVSRVFPSCTELNCLFFSGLNGFFFLSRDFRKVFCCRCRRCCWLFYWTVLSAKWKSVRPFLVVSSPFRTRCGCVNRWTWWKRCGCSSPVCRLWCTVSDRTAIPAWPGPCEKKLKEVLKKYDLYFSKKKTTFPRTAVTTATIVFCFCCGVCRHRRDTSQSSGLRVLFFIGIFIRWESKMKHRGNSIIIF